MKKLKKLLAILMTAAILTLGVSVSFAQTEPAAVRVASLKGPTSMGMVKLMIDDSESATQQDYEFTVAGAANEIVPLIAQDAIDIALIPCNLASTLYNNTGKIEVAAVNVLGVLYIVENGESVQSIEDLKGQTIFSTGKGTTPEYGLRHVLAKAGIDPDKDVTIEYKSEAAEVLAAIKTGLCSVAMLPQPFVTAAMSQVEGLRVALDLTEEWDKVDRTGSMVTGTVVVRKGFLEENPEAFETFLAEYAASTEYVNANPADETVCQWIDQLDIAKAAIAAKAIPECNIVCITGEEMKEAVSGYLTALHSQNPDAVGGKLPDDAFYHIPDAQ
ncbi:MAG: ABC transporter substrate-binding protein [Eubacteriales bacterium]|nr:ABC transporter substrate-binding protein [Eubacteriales bacterium]